MLQPGVFGGKYMTAMRNEFPEDWFTRAKLSPLACDCSLNFFGVDVSLPLSVWRGKWIHPDEPARLVPLVLPLLHGPPHPQEDHRQIKRWKAMRRHVRQIERHCQPG